MNFSAKKFEELTTTELYEIVKARAKIFIIERNIHYQDMDDIDYRCIHFFYQENKEITAYLRAFYQEDSKDIVQIGRVLTTKHGIGLGRKLMEESLAQIPKLLPCKKIVMNAQKYVASFYEKFGFTVTSDEFLEEGVIHVKMELNLK